MINAEYRSIDKRKMAISDKELSARLARVCSHTDPEIFRVYEALMRELDPRYAFARVRISIEDGEVSLGFCRVKSPALAKRLEGCVGAFVMLVTLGIEVDRMIARLSKTSRAEAFIFDAVASALAEAACNVANEEISEGLNTVKRFSPGYSDLTLDCQGPILDYLGASTYLGVSLSEANLMIPQKSISCIIGIREEEQNEYT